MVEAHQGYISFPPAWPCFDLSRHSTKSPRSVTGFSVTADHAHTPPPPAVKQQNSCPCCLALKPALALQTTAPLRGGWEGQTRPSRAPGPPQLKAKQHRESYGRGAQAPLKTRLLTQHPPFTRPLSAAADRWLPQLAPVIL